jgi:hypothetical protein
MAGPYLTPARSAHGASPLIRGVLCRGCAVATETRTRGPRNQPRTAGELSRSEKLEVAHLKRPLRNMFEHGHEVHYTVISIEPKLLTCPGTDEVDVLKDQIEQQQVNIESLYQQVHHWRERCASGTSSTNSNVLHDLLDQLQHVLRLSLDDSGRVYTAVAEAIYENTSPAQRDTIKEASSNKAEWIAYIADILQNG